MANDKPAPTVEDRIKAIERRIEDLDAEMQELRKAIANRQMKERPL